MNKLFCSRLATTLLVLTIANPLPGDTYNFFFSKPKQGEKKTKPKPKPKKKPLIQLNHPSTAVDSEDDADEGTTPDARVVVDEDNDNDMLPRPRVPQGHFGILLGGMPHVEIRLSPWDMGNSFDDFDAVSPGTALGGSLSFGYRGTNQGGINSWLGIYKQGGFNGTVVNLGLEFEYYALTAADYPWKHSPLEVAILLGASTSFFTTKVFATPHLGLKLVANAGRTIGFTVTARAGLDYVSTEGGVLFRF